MRIRIVFWTILCVMTAAVHLPPVLLAQTDWPYPGHDPGAARYSPLAQINTTNVAKLQRAWTFHTGNPSDDQYSEGAPLIVDNVMYFDAGKNVYALNPETGDLIWKFETAGTTRRGLSYWPGDKQTAPRIFVGVAGKKMLALDARTGKPIPDFGDQGFASGTAPSSAPAIYHDLVITGDNGIPSVRAWNARTGQLVWTFHTKAQPGEPGYDTWIGDSWKNPFGSDVWSFISVDAERGLVFVPIAPAGFPDYYGGLRLGNSLYADSLVALDAATGKMVWYQQLVHHDIWDYDIGSAPSLIDVKKGGKTIPAVAEITKQGLLFIFDRTNGTPLFGMEERPVPQSDVPEEKLSPTQPFPLKPPPLTRNSVTRDEIYNLTPEHAAFCKDLWDKNGMYNQGPFTPYTADPNKTSVIFPGREGGGNWPGVSFDPKLAYIFVNTVYNVGQTGRLVKTDQPNPRGGPYDKTGPFGNSPLKARFWDPDTGWPCVNPPWGELIAVNANTGEIAWRTPLGIVEKLAAKGFDKTGAPNLGSSVATAGGLVFIAATTDSRFRAFDSKTGKELWTAEIDAPGHTMPSTYQGKNGKQYVVVEAFGGGIIGSPQSDSVIAFALP